MQIIITEENYNIKMVHEIEKSIDEVLTKWGISRTGTAFTKNQATIYCRHFAQLLGEPKE